jgi:hypothetical protein
MKFCDRENFYVVAMILTIRGIHTIIVVQVLRAISSRNDARNQIYDPRS